MLGIIVTYFSCPEFLPTQLMSFKKFIRTPYKVLVVDDSEEGLVFPGGGNYAYIRTPSKNNYYGASGRHQTAVNFGIDVASKQLDCTDFLVFDNDMIFLSPFNLPTDSWYVPQQNGTLIGSWMNLLFLKDKVHKFDFARCPVTGAGSDSGGNFKGDSVIQSEESPDGFQALWINGACVVHFGAMSNWNKLTDDKYDEKKQRVIKFLTQLRTDKVLD
jgi:hypothetical protein